MPFKIDFSAQKPPRAINENYHDEAAWRCAHKWATDNQWPRQYTVHYMYELMNRPWVPELQQMLDCLAWMQDYQPNSEVKV